MAAEVEIMVIRGVWGGRVVWSGITAGDDRSKRRNDDFGVSKFTPRGIPAPSPEIWFEANYHTLRGADETGEIYLTKRNYQAMVWWRFDEKKGVLGWSRAFLHQK